MPRRGNCKRACLLVLLMMGAGPGCTPVQLDLNSSDPAQDQRKITHFYSQQAAKLRRSSEELSERALVYERLFGPESDWVTGARLLAQSYEEAAKEAERRAGKHQRLAGGEHAALLTVPEGR